MFVLFSQKQIAEFSKFHSNTLFTLIVPQKQTTNSKCFASISTPAEEAFALMDNDKDGIVGKSDLRSTFDALGKLCSDKELDEMLSEAQGPLNFTQLLTLFAARMSGGGATDDDDVVIAGFKSFDNGNGKIDSEKLRTSLITWGDKFTEDEVDDAFDQMVIDDKGFIDTAALITMLTGSEEEEE